MPASSISKPKGIDRTYGFFEPLTKKCLSSTNTPNCVVAPIPLNLNAVIFSSSAPFGAVFVFVARAHTLHQAYAIQDSP